MSRNKSSPEFRSKHEQDRVFRTLSGSSSVEARDNFSIIRPILGLNPVLDNVPGLKVAPQRITFARGLKQGEAHGVILSAFGSTGGIMSLLSPNNGTNVDNATAGSGITLQCELLDELTDDVSRLYIPVETSKMDQLVQEKLTIGQYTKNTVPNHLFPDCAVNLGVLSDPGELEATKVYLKEHLPKEIIIGAITVASSV